MVKADPKLPALIAQNVGCEVYHGRQDAVQIIGDKATLEKITWLFQQAPDMFTIQFKSASLIVRRAGSRSTIHNAKEVNAGVVSPDIEIMPTAH
jgi:hypothetical protein